MNKRGIIEGATSMFVSTILVVTILTLFVASSTLLGAVTVSLSAGSTSADSFKYASNVDYLGIVEHSYVFDNLRNFELLRSYSIGFEGKEQNLLEVLAQWDGGNTLDAQAYLSELVVGRYYKYLEVQNGEEFIVCWNGVCEAKDPENSNVKDFIGSGGEGYYMMEYTIYPRGVVLRMSLEDLSEDFFRRVNTEFCRVYYSEVAPC